MANALSIAPAATEIADDPLSTFQRHAELSYDIMIALQAAKLHGKNVEVYFLARQIIRDAAGNAALEQAFNQGRHEDVYRTAIDAVAARYIKAELAFRQAECEMRATWAAEGIAGYMREKIRDFYKGRNVEFDRDSGWMIGPTSANASEASKTVVFKVDGKSFGLDLIVKSTSSSGHLKVSVDGHTLLDHEIPRDPESAGEMRELEIVEGGKAEKAAIRGWVATGWAYIGVLSRVRNEDDLFVQAGQNLKQHIDARFSARRLLPTMPQWAKNLGTRLRRRWGSTPREPK